MNETTVNIKSYLISKGNNLNCYCFLNYKCNYQLCNALCGRKGESPIDKYGRMRRRYLKEYRKILYNNYVLEGTLFKHLAEIDQACNERIENIVSAMAKQEGVTEALKAADKIEWVRRMNSIRNRAEEIVLHELVYDL